MNKKVWGQPKWFWWFCGGCAFLSFCFITHPVQTGSWIGHALIGLAHALNQLATFAGALDL